MSDVRPREGGRYSLYCYDCNRWIPNTANHEMHKEGVYAHSHVCVNGKIINEEGIPDFIGDKYGITQCCKECLQLIKENEELKQEILKWQDKTIEVIEKNKKLQEELTNLLNNSNNLNPELYDEIIKIVEGKYD